jgi:hypothetical protein
MAEENKDKLSAQNENDYGFPFVKVTPLKAKEDQSNKAEEIQEPQIENIENKDEFPKIEKQISSNSPFVKKKRSQLPLQFSLVMLILIILAAMAYFLYFLPDAEIDGPKSEPVERVGGMENITEQADRENDQIVTDGSEDIGQDEELIMEEEEEPLSDVIQDPQPLPLGDSNIFQVRQGSSPPQYYVIISSTTSEQVALKQTGELKDKNINVWLIYPYGETTNYRLSIGKYTALADASQALEKFKADFGASIWILKY